MKITFMGAGSTIFARNVLGDCMYVPALQDAEIALYDIGAERLKESETIISAMNKSLNGERAKITSYLGAENRKAALKGSNFIVNAIQVGGYEPCTVTDFEIPKKYGLRQTIADTLGIGGIMRALRTIPVMEEFARDAEEVCPDALFMNYTNPMAMLTGYMTRYMGIHTVGLCHSVQVCAKELLEGVNMSDKLEGHRELIAGINHMAWLLKIADVNGNDLYPEIRRRAIEKNAKEKHADMVRFEYIKHLGYYCTESSEHNAEYNPFFIKAQKPELIDKYNIPLDEYPRRCVKQIADWKEERDKIMTGGNSTRERSREYASHIIEAVTIDKPYKFGGNVLNISCITNLPSDACVEVPCIADANGITPLHVGAIPSQCAALNLTNVNVQMMTIEAAHTKKREKIYHAAMVDPHTSAELSLDEIRSLCDDLINAHGKYMAMYK